MKEIDAQLADAIMERPHVLKTDNGTLYLYPMTLGKNFLLQRFVENIGITVSGNIEMEILKAVMKSKDAVCEMLSYMMARNDYYSVFDNAAMEERKAILKQENESELATVLLMLLSSDKTTEFIKHLHIDEEQRNMSKVTKVKEKSDKNSFSFGGLSLYGSLIDVAMERYGLTKRQVVWEMDYTSLRLLLADRVTSVYVTDAERRKIHISKDRIKVNGDDKSALMKAIKSQKWE